MVKVYLVHKYTSYSSLRTGLAPRVVTICIHKNGAAPHVGAAPTNPHRFLIKCLSLPL